MIVIFLGKSKLGFWMPHYFFLLKISELARRSSLFDFVSEILNVFELVATRTSQLGSVVAQPFCMRVHQPLIHDWLKNAVHCDWMARFLANDLPVSRSMPVHQSPC